MKCALCGYIFYEKDARASCSGCLMAKNCDLIRCPNCGYETAREPKWLDSLRNRMSKFLAKFSAGISKGIKKIFNRRDKNGTDRKS